MGFVGDVINGAANTVGQGIVTTVDTVAGAFGVGGGGGSKAPATTYPSMWPTLNAVTTGTPKPANPPPKTDSYGYAFFIGLTFEQWKRSEGWLINKLLAQVKAGIISPLQAKEIKERQQNLYKSNGYTASKQLLDGFATMFGDVAKATADVGKSTATTAANAAGGVASSVANTVAGNSGVSGAVAVGLAALVFVVILKR